MSALSDAAPGPQEYADSFDLLRLIAALMVLWSHQFVLVGLVPPPVPFVGNYGHLGLCIFFAISGYLNMLSLLRTRSISYFAVSRILRIYPALMVCIVLCILMGAVVTTDPAAFWGRKTLSFLKNVTLISSLRYELPGVFESNPLPRSVNGSLWTLPYEVRLYVLLALAMLLCAFRAAWCLLAGVVVLVVLSLLAPKISDVNWVNFGLLFLSGSVFAGVQVVMGLRLAMMAVSVGAVLMWILVSPNAGYVAAACLTIVVGLMPPPAWLRPRLDISYGVYIYAFPVQQLVAMRVTGFWIALILSLIATLALALASALLVEQPALRLKSRFRRGMPRRSPLPARGVD
jgi:peptidoglycan/LPS O-acetylase OafA/YrhL